MGEASTGMIVLFVTTVVVSAICHAFVRNLAAASVVAAVVSSVLFQCFAYLHAGYLDPFFLIAFVVAGFLAFGIALVVGVPFLYRRRKCPPGHCPECRYDLTGNTSGICPECGKLIAAG
jgi:hypothetical protein